ncbi:unnamed protein product [Lymnaea stagnalis]|uniref:Coiled-coil domain-containing protein 167 n=1 Tax=Lymnaea stagnalis TaxID=6523 RepID=A0AAV2HKS8_LYMST
MKTIATEIEVVEKDIEKCEKRLDDIERMRRLTKMTIEERTQLKDEMKLLEKQILNNKIQLKSLRWENWRSMLLSVVLLGLVYLGVTIYYGPLNSQTSLSSSR